MPVERLNTMRSHYTAWFDKAVIEETSFDFQPTVPCLWHGISLRVLGTVPEQELLLLDNTIVKTSGGHFADSSLAEESVFPGDVFFREPVFRFVAPVFLEKAEVATALVSMATYGPHKLRVTFWCSKRASRRDAEAK